MNYPESKLILEEIKKANRILINCHRSPDPDSVGSALSLFLIMQQLEKTDVLVICPDEIPFSCKFLPNVEKIRKVDFDKFIFEEYDLLIIADSGNWEQITGEENIKKSKINTIVLDHHYTNNKYGNLNLIDVDAGSTAALIFKLSEDLGIDIKEDLANSLLTGIIADTISFQTDIIGGSSLLIADKLIKSGGDRNKIILNLFKSKSLDEIHLMGYMLTNTKIENEYGFAWTVVSKDVSTLYPKSRDAKSFISNSFIPSIEGTDFGFVLEESDLYMSVSFRSKGNFDVSKIAEELGGGGHKAAAAARLLGMKFDEAVDKVLVTCKKYANKKT